MTDRPQDAPSHAGFFAVVPVWAWDVDADGPTLHPRWGLPYLLLETAAFLQVSACEVLDDEPHFRINLKPITPAGRKLWRFERVVARLLGRCG